MDVQQVEDRIRETYSARRVFGEPISLDGVTVIPAARIRGGGGGGQNEDVEGQGKGSGGGFGVLASPAGVYEIREGTVRWKPAFDPNRIIMGGQIVAAIGLLTVGRILVARINSRRRGWRS
jgi:uncharacterized spore protein YtfJ